jgi:hypothetical protein
MKKLFSHFLQNFKPNKKANHRKSFFFFLGKKSSTGDIRQNLSGVATMGALQH